MACPDNSWGKPFSARTCRFCATEVREFSSEMPPSTATSIFGSTEFKLFFVIQCLTSVIRVLSWAPYLKGQL